MGKKVKYDQKSGVTSTGKEWLSMNGGMPSKKSVEQIEKVNRPKSCHGAVGR